jgi:flagellar hook-associated protein 1 FlgK
LIAIRDGGLAGALYNPAGNAGFSARLQELVTSFRHTAGLSPSSVELDPDASLNSFRCIVRELVGKWP